MPVMGGIEVLEKFSKDGIINHIPVFLITGATDGKIIKRAYEYGVMDVISKPVSPYIVQRRVNSVIELFTARKRLSGVVDQQRDQLLEQAKRILKLNMGMIESLSTAIEFRSGESGEHVRRIYDLPECFLKILLCAVSFLRKKENMFPWPRLCMTWEKFPFPTPY